MHSPLVLTETYILLFAVLKTNSQITPGKVHTPREIILKNVQKLASLSLNSLIAKIKSPYC